MCSIYSVEHILYQSNAFEETKKDRWKESKRASNIVEKKTNVKREREKKKEKLALEWARSTIPIIQNCIYLLIFSFIFVSFYIELLK